MVSVEWPSFTERVRLTDLSTIYLTVSFSPASLCALCVRSDDDAYDKSSDLISAKYAETHGENMRK